MALKIIDHGTKEYQQMVKLRDDILRKPLGLTFNAEELENEKNNLLIGAFEDDSMLGCCMAPLSNQTSIRSGTRFIAFPFLLTNMISSTKGL